MNLIRPTCSLYIGLNFRKKESQKPKNHTNKPYYQLINRRVTLAFFYININISEEIILQ
jgi:hypothetical protein